MFSYISMVWPRPMEKLVVEFVVGVMSIAGAMDAIEFIMRGPEYWSKSPRPEPPEYAFRALPRKSAKTS